MSEVKYIRADLMAELVEAAEGVLCHMPDHADTAWQDLVYALAKIKEKQT